MLTLTGGILCANGLAVDALRRETLYGINFDEYEYEYEYEYYCNILIIISSLSYNNIIF